MIVLLLLTGVVRFNFKHKPVVEWKGGKSIPKGHIISCVKTCKMISKDCISLSNSL